MVNNSDAVVFSKALGWIINMSYVLTTYYVMHLPAQVDGRLFS